MSGNFPFKKQHSPTAMFYMMFPFSKSIELPIRQIQIEETETTGGLALAVDTVEDMGPLVWDLS